MQVGADGVALMVQVASPSVVVVEYPRGACSKELAGILADPYITKVAPKSWLLQGSAAPLLRLYPS